MISLDKAVQALRAAEQKARELNCKVSIAIVDDHGALIAFVRMDGALHISPRFSQAKAFTSAALGLPTSDVAGYAGEGKPYFSINTSFGGELMVIPGGLPVKQNGQVVGGVGVGGSLDVNQDVECAKAAAQILESA